MKTIYNLLIILTVLTLVTVASTSAIFGLMFFMSGAAIISVGRYADSVLTSKIKSNEIS